MIKIYKEPAGVISSVPIWIAMYSCYMHCNESFWSLIWELITEFKNEKHLVGY